VTWGSVVRTWAALNWRMRLSLVGEAGAGVVGAGFEGHAEDADGELVEGVAAFEAVDEVEGEAFVDGHGGVAEGEVVVVEGGELHGVLEQAGSGGEAGSGHVGGAG